MYAEEIRKAAQSATDRAMQPTHDLLELIIKRLEATERVLGIGRSGD